MPGNDDNRIFINRHQFHMEQYRSGHNEADSKSVSPSGPVGSNPTCSAKKSILQGCFFIYIMKKGSLQRSPTQKAEKPVRGVVSSTNESGVRALALPHAWVLLGSRTVGKAMGRPFYVQTKGQLFPTCVSYAGYAHQREESPASALPYCFSVFCFLVLHCLLSIIGRF